jgi:hypothetical protein
MLTRLFARATILRVQAERAARIDKKAALRIAVSPPAA